MAKERYDAVVVGSGPNGLAAGVTLARERLSVLLLEGDERIGGGLRSAELTLPGFTHDICAAVHALGVSSPVLRSLDLASHGLNWVFPPAAVAHPLDDGTAVILRPGLETLREDLGQDGHAMRRILGPMVQGWEPLVEGILRPLPWPRNPLLLGKFGMKAVLSAVGLAKRHLKTRRAQALFAGLAAHSVLPLDRHMSASVGLVLGAAAIAVGWPLVKGGSQALADALACVFRSLGGEIQCNRWVSSWADIPEAKVILLDLTPRNLVRLGAGIFPPAYMRRLQEHPLGPGAFKLDWALSEPIPWRAKECLLAATVHLGGSMEEIVRGEGSVWKGRAPEKPFVILVQPTLFDPTRAPEGRHVAWAYCHVPNGWDLDVTERIERQVERFAPGFSDTILARSVWGPRRFEEHNPNYTGGDFLGGPQDPVRLLVRPLGRWRRYRTPREGVYICSSSMPPGGGAHGMCGHNAARSALSHLFSA